MILGRLFLVRKTGTDNLKASLGLVQHNTASDKWMPALSKAQ